MFFTTDKLIANAVSIEGYTNPVSYNPNAEQSTWLCKKCKSIFNGKDRPLHHEQCPIKYTPLEDTYNHPDMIRVIGRNEGEPHSIYSKSELERIKQIATTAGGGV